MAILLVLTRLPDGKNSGSSKIDQTSMPSTPGKERSHGSRSGYKNIFSENLSAAFSENSRFENSRSQGQDSMVVQYSAEIPPSASSRSHMTEVTRHSSHAASPAMSVQAIEDMLTGIGQHVSFSNMSLPRAAPRRRSMPLDILRWRFDVGSQVRKGRAQPRRRTDSELHLRMPFS